MIARTITSSRNAAAGRRSLEIVARQTRKVLRRLNEIVVVPVTRTVRGISTEVVLTGDDGMPVRCALNLDHVALAQRAQFGEVIATLRDVRWPEVEKALLIACGFASGEAA